MDRNLKENLRRITAFVLTATMVFGLDNGYCLNSVYADTLQPEIVEVTEELIADDAVDNEEEILEEQTALEEHDVEPIEEDSMESEEKTDEIDDVSLKEGVVHFDNPNFYMYIHNRYFYAFEGDSELTAAIRGLKKLNSEGNYDEATSGYIDSAQLAKITELEFVYDDEYCDDFGFSPYSTLTHYNQIDFSELSKFPNLNKVTIYDAYLCRSVEASNAINATTIALPDSIQSVSLHNCKFYSYLNGEREINWCKPDFSNCVNLNNLEIVNCEFKEQAEYKEIKGLNVKYGLDDTTHPEESELKNLQKIKIDNTNIKRLSLANEGVLSDGLLISAYNCTNLELFSSGGYRLICRPSDKQYANAPYFKNCTNLKTALILGLCDGDNQGIDFSACYNLDCLHLEFYFTDASYNYKIKATGIEKSSGEFSVSYASGSKTGKFDLETFLNSFLYKTAISDDYSDMFVSKDYSEKKVAFIVFAQDANKFEKNELYKEVNASKRRSYDANPIYLYMNQKIADNRPYFYSEDGTLLQNVKYKISVTNSEIPTEEKNNEGYEIISVGETAGDPVTAKNPGTAELKVTTLDGNSISFSQKIVVFNPITSVKFVEDGQNTIVYEDDKKKLASYVEFQTKYPSLNNLHYLVPSPVTVESTCNGKDWTYKQSTPAGLTVFYEFGEQSAIFDRANNKVKFPIYYDPEKKTATYDPEKEGLANGEFGLRVSAAFAGNVVSGEFRYKTFGVVGGGELMYYSSGDGNIPSEGILQLPDTGLFDTGKIDIKVRNEAAYSGFVKLDEMAVNKYKISFTGDQKNIADGLASQREPKYIIDVQLTDNNDKIHKFTKIYDLFGRFDVKYFNYDGTTEGARGDNSSSYYIPYKNMGTNSTYLHPPKDEREGYEFVGWYSQNNILVPKLGEGDYGDLELTARYKIEEYNISYELYRGQNNPENPATYNVNTDTITLKAPSRKDSEFLGWFTSETATEPVTQIEKGSKGDIKLYARWKLDEGHVHTMIVDDYVAPTCTTPGKTEGISCGVCWKILKVQRVIPALGHDLDEGTVTKEPTATETGVITYKCKNHGCDYKEEDTIPVLGDLGDIIYEDASIIFDPSKPELTDTTINIIGVEDATYTGKAITFDERVYVGKTLLKEGTDYSIKYVNNKNASAADTPQKDKPAVIITGKGAYKDSSVYKFEPVYFEIKPLDISANEEVYVSNMVDNIAKKTKLIKPVPTITIGDKKLSKKDYSVDYGTGKSGIDASVVGVNTITLTGTGNYTGSVTATYELVDGAPLLSKASISGIKKTLPYNEGNSVKQSGYTISCKIDKENKELIEGTDYLVNYFANREVGTASMIITAIPGNEKGVVGEKVVNFKITGKSINSLTFTYEKKIEYTGLSIKPEITIFDKSTGKNLVYGQDYDIEYTDNVLAAKISRKKNGSVVTTGKAAMLITGKGLYSGTVKKSFMVKEADIATNALISAAVVPGSVKKATEGKYKNKYTADVVVKFNSKVLTAGKDYTITYKNNSSAGSKADGKNAPQVIIKGKGDFTGTLSIPFDI